MKFVWALVASSLFVASVFADKERRKSKAPRIAPLKILESYTVPAVEISGMAWRKNPQTQKRELVIVGDREHKIYLIDWETRNTSFAVREVDLKPLESKGKKMAKGQQSQWESVFSDDSGRLFIIQEDPAEILVVAADLKRIEARIKLHVPSSETAWHEDTNSKGEGLLPLKNGHVLVVKEKDPLQILEFSPAGKEAEGYQNQLAIENVGHFPLPKQDLTLTQSFAWQLSGELEDLFEDSSGLNVDPKGRLYLLGDQKNFIGRIGKRLKKDKSQIKMSHLWSIPSELKQPEGMVIDEEMRPVIAVDTKKTDRPNLFLLSSMGG